MNVSDRIGTTLGILAAVVGIFSGGFLLGDTANPEVADKVLAPADPTPVPFCKVGWEQHEDRVLDAVAYSCTRGTWRVVLKADKTFSHAYQENTPNATFIYDPGQVPEWGP